jgi:AAA+ superfamily predicted ATPase
MAKRESFFRLKQKIRFKDIKDGHTLPESDLCFQNDTCIFQFEYIENVIDSTIDVKPGVFKFSKDSSSLVIKHMELRTNDILLDITNSKKIYEEANVFFNNLNVYEELGETKARKILLFSDPGMGKSSTIVDYCHNAIREDLGTVVIVWPTSTIDSFEVLNFLSKSAEYTKECTRLILVIEDIGGGEREGDQGSRSVDSALLDILDGIGVTFKLPTLIIATTNYPQNLLSALADRPGRFDLMLKLNPPSPEERVRIVEFISKRSLTEEEKISVLSNEINNFSIAHLKEVIIRARLHKKSICDTIRELIEHKNNFKQAYEDKRGVGF